MTRFSPCPSCERHVRVGSPACPFCSSELSVELEEPIYRPTKRLGRAAMLAFRTLVIGAAGAGVGCGAATGLEPPGDAGGGTVLVDSGSPATDAGPPTFDAGFDAGTTDAGFDAGMTDPPPIPAYGGPTPTPFDAGPEDGGPDDAGMPVGNLYGAPPIPG